MISMRQNVFGNVVDKISFTLSEYLNMLWYTIRMMTSSNENIFRVTGPLRGEFTGHRWIPLTKASDAELWYFLWCAPEQTVFCMLK